MSARNQQSVHICPNTPHDHDTAGAPVRVYDTLTTRKYATWHYGEEAGYGRIGKGKAAKCGLSAGVYADIFHAVLVALGWVLPSATVVLEASICRIDGRPADVDRFTNDSVTGRFVVTCGWCDAVLTKVGYGPGLGIVCSTRVNGSALTANPEVARIRDDEGARMLDLLAERLA